MSALRFESARLVVRDPSEADIPAMPGVFCDPDIYANTRSIPYPYTEKDAAEAIERFARLRAEDASHTFFIDLKETGELIGSVGSLNIKNRESAEFGYAIGRAWWGRGYATEASGRLLDHCFDDLGFAEMYAHAMTRNPASIRVLQKLGMRSEGVIPNLCEKDGEHFDAEGFTITREQWQARERDD